MSYCRFAPGCDVYVYREGGTGQWITHVAGQRLLEHPDHPVGEFPDDPEADDFAARLDAYLEAISLTTPEPIPLQFAGSEHRSDTASECAELLTRLASKGFQVPSGILDELRAEAPSAA